MVFPVAMYGCESWTVFSFTGVQLMTCKIFKVYNVMIFICMHCESIFSTWLINTSLTSCLSLFLVRSLLSTTVTMLNIRSSDFSYLIAENLYPTTSISLLYPQPSFLPLFLWVQLSTTFLLCFYEFDFSNRCQICDTMQCLYFSDLFQLSMFVHSCCHEGQDFRLWKGWIYHIF